MNSIRQLTVLVTSQGSVGLYQKESADGTVRYGVGASSASVAIWYATCDAAIHSII